MLVVYVGVNLPTISIYIFNSINLEQLPFGIESHAVSIAVELVSHYCLIASFLNLKANGDISVVLSRGSVH